MSTSPAPRAAAPARRSRSGALSPVELIQSLTKAAPARNGDMQSHAHYEQTGEKYHERNGKLSTGQIREHQTGSRTYAAPAAHSGGTGLTCWGPVDIDEAAAYRIPLILRAAASIGVPMIGELFDHDRGYVHLRFDEPQSAQRVTALLQQITALAGVTGVDIRTTTSSITRLLGGRHTHTGKRGTFILQSGLLLSIDDDAHAAWSTICNEWHAVDPAHLPIVQQPKAKNEQHSAAISTLIERFMAEHDTETLLKQYGAQKRRGTGKGLYVCPFHADNNPSLKVYKDQGGRMACRCYSRNSNCPLSERGHYDAFNVYCIGEGTNGTPLAPLDALKQCYPECFTSDQQQTTAKAANNAAHTAAVHTAAPPLSWNAIAQQKAKTQTATGGWYTDQELKNYVKEYGRRTGVYMLHQAYEKLGEDATNAALIAEIARKRGKEYNERTIRRLKNQRRQLIADWEATKQPRGADILSPVHVYIESSVNLACEGGILPGEIPIHAQPEDFQADLPIEPPPVAPIAPLLVPTGKAKRATLPKNPTIDDIPAFEKARDKARSRVRSLVHFQQTSAARAVNRRVLEYQRIIDELKAKQAALQPSLLEHQPASEPDLPPSQAVPDSGSLPTRDETVRPGERPFVSLPTAERGGGERSVSGVAAASAAGPAIRPEVNPEKIRFVLEELPKRGALWARGYLDRVEGPDKWPAHIRRAITEQAAREGVMP